jgi:hypothetical protein
MCDTPPFEKMKITRFALAGKCGSFAASGSASAADAESASSCKKMPGSSSEPPTMLRMASRRVKRGMFMTGQ